MTDKKARRTSRIDWNQNHTKGGRAGLGWTGFGLGLEGIILSIAQLRRQRSDIEAGWSVGGGGGGWFDDGSLFFLPCAL